MEFQVLGSLRVMHDEAPVYVATANKPRLLLAMLCAYPGQVLSVEKLTHELWGDKPPSSARQNLHQYMHRLRLALGAGLLPNLPAGYSLSADASIDSATFLSRVRSGSAAFDEGDFDKAAQELWAGLQLWRGEAFADLTESELIRAAADTLEQQRIAATEHWADAKTRIGQAKDVVPVLTASVARNPLNENLRAQLMRALAVTGRQAEALELFRDTRALLIDQLAIEPGAALTAAHQAILRGEVIVNPVPPPFVAPKELPANVSGFVGRDDALAELDAMLPSNQDDPAGAVIISAIAGTAGVGKTALAIRWSHRVSSRFPDGQLHLNLNGYSTADPMTPMAALSSLLGSLGTKPNEVPPDLHSAAARYRTLLSGRRMLILLDNARSAEQVRPLLPGSPGCLVVVTSRDRLNGLVANEGAHRLNLDTLSPAEAVALLKHLLGTQRFSAEPQAFEDLANVCAYLPLALRIAAARIADQAHLTIKAYVEALRSQNPAAALATDEGAVHTTFQLSYEGLSQIAQRAFRCLGLLPLHDFTPVVIAQLALVSSAEAAEALEQLASAHLVSSVKPGRYTTHDLLRHFASMVAVQEDPLAGRSSAISRVYSWYLATIHAAANSAKLHIVRLSLPPECGTTSAEFDGGASALAWLNDERQNFLLLIGNALQYGPLPMVWQLVDGLRGYYEQIQYTAGRLSMARMAVAAARIEDDSTGKAAALLALAHACFGVGRHQCSIRYLKLAAVHAREAGWLEGEAAIWSNLGSTQGVVGLTNEAIRSVRISTSLYQIERNLLGEARSREALANVLRLVGRLADGVIEAELAMQIFERVGSKRGVAQCFECLGELYLDLDMLELARSSIEKSLRIHTELRSPFRMAVARMVLARISLGSGNVPEAREQADQAHSIIAELRDLRLGAKTATLLGDIAMAEHDDETAGSLYREAISKASATGSSHPRCEAHLGMSAFCLATADTRGALENAQLALELGQNASLHVLEGQALNQLANVHLRLAAPNVARDFAKRALELNMKTGHMPGEVRSRDLIAQCDVALAVVGELKCDP